MLYNKDWDRKHSADAFALDTLILWLEDRDPDEDYNYRSCSECLLAKYFGSHGMIEPVISRNFVTSVRRVGPFVVGGKMDMLPPLFDWIARGSDHIKDHTFGQALERAKLARDKPFDAVACSMRSFW